jgi:transcription antitermination factor NusG
MNLIRTPEPLRETTDSSRRNWYALYTRPNFEKCVDKELKKYNIHSYLPLRSVLRQWSDRKKWLEVPLFSCYVFVWVDNKERFLSLKPGGVVCMLSNQGKPSKIPNQEIQLVKKMLSNGFDPEPVDEFIYGESVEIIAGPLQGICGLFLESRGKDRLIVSFDSIGQSVAIEIKRSAVRKIMHHHSDMMRNNKTGSTFHKKLIAA